jgi:Tat protein secretion system quality control protein TatD with DNase activity
VSGVSKVASTPKTVWTTLRLLAELKGLAQQDVLAVVNNNARTFFNLGDCSPMV